MAGLSSNSPQVRTLALVKVTDWQFQRPVYVGDTVHAVTQVESISPRGRRSGEVVWFRKLLNQRDECVQSGRIYTIVSSHSFLPRPQPITSGVKLSKFKTTAADSVSSAIVDALSER